MPFPLKRLVLVLCALGCSTYIDPGSDPLDVSVGDAGMPDVRAPDASELADAFELDAPDTPDSTPGPELADCFSEPLLIAQASSRLSYDPVEHVGDLRLRITQLDLDDSSPTGFAVRTGALGASFTALLPRRLAYQRYSLRGDMLRVVGPSVSTHGGPYQTVLAQLDVRSLAGNEDLWYEIQESFTWGEGEELGSMLTGELHRMVRYQTNEDGSRGIHVESFPEHPGVTGQLGEGAYHVIDDMFFGIHRVDGEMQIVRDSDLFVIGQTNMEGDFAGAARWGDDVAFLSKRRNSEGTVLLEMHCVETSVPSRP